MKKFLSLSLCICGLCFTFVYAQISNQEQIEKAVDRIVSIIDQKGPEYGAKVVDGLIKLKEFFRKNNQLQKIEMVDFLINNIQTKMQYTQKDNGNQDLNVILNRNQVSDYFKWNINDIYKNDEEWNNDFERVSKEYLKLGEYKGKLNNSQSLLEFLKKSDEISMILDKLYSYASLQLSIDQSSSNFTILTEKISTLGVKISEIKAYSAPELLSYSQDVLDDYIKDPKFADYKLILKDLVRQKSHVLSAKEEELLAKISKLSGSSANTFEKLTNADFTYPKYKDDQGNLLESNRTNLLAILESNKRETRKLFFDGYYSVFGSYRNALASLLYGHLKEADTFAKASNYKSVFDQSFEGLNLSTKIFDNLIKTTNDNLKLVYKGTALRKKVLGLEKVHMYDFFVSLVKDSSKKYSYDDAKRHILNALSVLGDDYIKVISQAFDNRWIDVYQDSKKNNGAFASGLYGVHPYVLLNYNNTFDSVTTMAHELGHAMYNYYSAIAQPYSYSYPTIFTHEVASTVNELLLNDYFANNAKTDDEKLYYLNRLVTTIDSTFFTQVMYSEFEKTINDMVNQDQALTADVLDEVWKKIVIKYKGPDMEYDEVYNSKWSTIPHFYSPFYVYKYATSIAASNQIVQKIKQKDPQVIAKYIDFLKSGANDYPNELLKIAGVDLTKPDAINGLMEYYGSLVDEMENIYRKKGLIK